MNTRNFSKAVEAVSPVVATLLLVLVAAGAAIGFGVFLNGFQKDTQENVASNAPESELRIGGSSTVYDFTNAAKVPFETANPSIKVDLQRGGSGGGLTAICLGNLDIGSSSDDPTTLGAWANCPDLNGDGKKDAGREVKLTKVAYDAIVMVHSAGALQAGGTCAWTQQQVIELYKVNGFGAARTAAATADLGRVSAIGSGAYTWADLIDASGPCAGATIGTNNVGTNVVVLGQRSDNGGTEADFCNFVVLLDATICDPSTKQIKSSGGFIAANFLGSGGAGGNGNDNVGAQIGASAKAVGFLDAGGAYSPSKQYNGANPLIKIDGFGTTVATMVPYHTSSSFAYSPSATTVPSGHKSAVQNCIAKLPAATNVQPACRTMFYMTIGEPQGNARAYLDFVTMTQNNIDFANAGFFVPLY